MRLLVILNPTNKWGTKTEYTKFRKFLASDGYLRIAPEVYMRIVQNRKAAQKHYRRLDEYVPQTGTVTIFRLTEKQYASAYRPVVEQDYQEKVVGINSHIML
jgi:CRISPR-associated protein Cas2